MALDTTPTGWGLTPIGTPTTSTAPLAPAQAQFTPEQIRQMRAEAMALQQPPTQPIRHWTQGLAELVRAIQGNREADFARQQEAAGRARGAEDISKIYSPYLSPGSAASPGAGAASAGTSGGATADASAANDPRGMIPYIRETATKYGVDPDVAVRVAQSEGLGSFLGDNGKSGGAFQLYTGGGMGNEFQRDTGLDPLDPKNEKATIDYALKNVPRTGWTPFHGARRVGIGEREGITDQSKSASAGPSGLFAPIPTPTPRPTDAPQSPASAPVVPPTPTAAAAPPPVRLAYAGGDLPPGILPQPIATGGQTPVPPAPAAGLAPIVNAIAGKPLPPPIPPDEFAAQANAMEANKPGPGLPHVVPQATPVPTADFVRQANEMAPKSVPGYTPMPQPRPAGAPISPTVAPMVSAIAGEPASAAGAPIPPPPVRVAQAGPATAGLSMAPPEASPSGLPQPLTSAAGQVTQEQLMRVLANPWVPDQAKAAMLQMIQQRGQPQSMPVEGGTLMYNSAGQRVFIPEPKFGTLKVGSSEIPIVSHFDPATRQWNTTTMTPGAGVQTPGGAATGQPPRPGEPDLSTLGGIQRAEAAQAGAKKSAETGAEAAAKYYDSLHKGLTGSAMIAAQQKQNIDLLRQVADSPNFTPGYGSDAALGLQRIAAQLGINPEGAAPRELFNQVATRILADQISGIKSMASETGETGSRIFKSMLDLEEKANITPQDTAAGVKAKLNLIDNAGNLMMKWADLADEYVQKHGKLDAGFDKELRAEISKARIPNAVPGAKEEPAPTQDRSAIEAEMRRRGLLPSSPVAPPVSQ